MLTRRAFLAGAAASLAACATRTSIVPEGGPAAAAPEFRVGDRWTYRVEDRLPRRRVWDETHEVIAVGGDGIRVKVTQQGTGIEVVRGELLTAPGLVRVGALYDAETRRFKGALERFLFPLASGKSWNQRIGNFNETLLRDGEIERSVQVGGWTSVATPAGSFDAIELRVRMRLDDGEFYRRPTECEYTTWYAPAVRNVVRELRNARHFDATGYPTSDVVRTQNAVLELVAWTPGR